MASSMHRRSSSETTIRYPAQSLTRRTLNAVNPFRRKSINGLLDLFRKLEPNEEEFLEPPMYPLQRVSGPSFQTPESKTPMSTVRSMMNSLRIRGSLRKSGSRWSLRSKPKRDLLDEDRPRYRHDTVSDFGDFLDPTSPIELDDRALGLVHSNRVSFDPSRLPSIDQKIFMNEPEPSHPLRQKSRETHVVVRSPPQLSITVQQASTPRVLSPILGTTSSLNDDKSMTPRPSNKKLEELYESQDAINPDVGSYGHVHWDSDNLHFSCRSRDAFYKKLASTIEDPFTTSPEFEAESPKSPFRGRVDSGYMSSEALRDLALKHGYEAKSEARMRQSLEDSNALRPAFITRESTPEERMCNEVYPIVLSEESVGRSSMETVESENARASSDQETFKEVVIQKPQRPIRRTVSHWRLPIHVQGPPTPPPAEIHTWPANIAERSHRTGLDNTEEVSIVELLQTGNKWIENTYAPMGSQERIYPLPRPVSRDGSQAESIWSMNSRDSTLSGFSSEWGVQEDHNPAGVDSAAECRKENTHRNSPSLD